MANNGADSGPAAAAAAAKKLALPAASVARMQQELKIHGSQVRSRLPYAPCIRTPCTQTPFALLRTCPHQPAAMPLPARQRRQRASRLTQPTLPNPLTPGMMPRPRPVCVPSPHLQAKCVWEVLLYLHADKQALPALAALLKVRLEAAHFASVARHAEKKRLQDTENAHGEAYIMYVMSKGEAAWRAKKAAEATAAEEKRGAGPGTAAAGASSSAAGEEGVELSLAGRGSRVESTSKEEKEEKLAELLNARFEEMEAIKSILGRAGLTAGPRQ